MKEGGLRVLVTRGTGLLERRLVEILREEKSTLYRLKPIA
jgi:hypothetical protein